MAWMGQNFRFEIRSMVLGDSAAVANVHGRSFSRPWSDGEVEQLLVQTNVGGQVATQSGGALCGFVLYRQAEEEAEILTLAVEPRWRRRGVGHRLMAQARDEVSQRGVASLFLEVEDSNQAARALYKGLGFRQVGHRPGYYRHEGNQRGGALVMRLDIG